MRPLPTGTVTFLFSDIEGSTKLLQELGDRYADVLAEHRRLLRNVFARHGGVEVDTQGDSFFVAFSRASDALAAAADSQAALEGGRVRVRMGVHTGEPQVTPDGYVGIDVHRAARVMAAGHGGQVLVSQATRALVDEGVDLRDLGPHRLKDMTAGERLFQLGGAEFPPLKSLNQTNLPVQPTPLVGRQRELADVDELLQRHRLLTLVGPGGTGKTRLALQAAAEAVDRFDDGVWWVSLAGVSDPDLVETTIAGTIGGRDGLADVLLGRRALLLLDNFEHLLGAAPLVSRLLADAPEVKALVTSRAALHVVGEQEYPVPPLPDPDAAALFTERARSFDPGFEPDQHVTEICRRLDGLPLAIELAAARVRALPAARMVERLSSVLPLLTAGARDAPERQRTLSATIEWSYNLLAEDEARLLDAVSVFAGSFSLEAAEDVCDATLDSIESLIDKSLLRRTAEGRFFLLETVREFAADRLSRSGERDAVCRRHVDHLVRLAAEAERDRGATVDSWRRFASEQDNFREALSWAQAVGDVGAQLELIGSTWPFWWYRGNAREGLRWVETALGTSGDERSRRTVRVNAAGAMFAFRGGDTRALERYSAVSLDTAREIGDPATMVWPLILRGLWAARNGDYGRSAELYEEAIAVAELVGDRQLIGIAKNNLGSNAMEQKDYAQAIELFEEAVAISRDLVATDELALETLNVALCHHRLGRTAEALAKAREGFALAREAESLSTLGFGFTLLGALAYRQGRDPAAAATLIGVGQGLVRRLGEEDAEDPELDELFESARSGLAHALGEERCAEAVATGDAMPLDDALAYALIVE